MRAIVSNSYQKSYYLFEIFLRQSFNKGKACFLTIQTANDNGKRQIDNVKIKLPSPKIDNVKIEEN